MQNLKLSKDTISVLKNFNSINKQIWFKPGNLLSTKSVGNTILATYNCPETFKTECGIGTLDKFLSLLSLYNEPEVEFHDSYLLVKQDKQEGRIKYVVESCIAYPKVNEVPLGEVFVTLDLTEDQIKTIIKLSSLMGLPEIAFIGDGEKISLVTLNMSLHGLNGDNYRIELGETDKTFKVLFNVENIKLIPANYKVELGKKGVGKFASDKLTYFIVMQKNSEF